MSNLIRRHTQDEEDVISIDFKPWSSSTPDAIIKDFFETLQDELSPYHAALSRLLIRYSRKLTSIDSNVITQTIEYAANYILDLDATNKVYEKINAALKDIDKKIIIYIDDLDRLEQSEIMEVIRLIRNTANFYNTFFIVAYDKEYVNNALKDAKIHNHEKFLENKALNSYLLSNIFSDLNEDGLEEYLDGNKSNMTFYFSNKHINKLYDNKQFVGLLYNNLSNPQVKEFKEFYDKLKEAKFEPTTFVFNNIPIEDRIRPLLAGISNQHEKFNDLSEQSGIS